MLQHPHIVKLEDIIVQKLTKKVKEADADS